MYSVDVQMFCCKAACVETDDCEHLFNSKCEAKEHVQSLKRQIRKEACCDMPLMMIEEFIEREKSYRLTVTGMPDDSDRLKLP